MGGRAMRSKLNYSEVARKSGLSVSFISRLMRGKRSPSLSSFVRVAKAINVDANKMLRILKEKK
jgi:transcriptional regulator with XRE-family HTH domain